jgi:uncharacterized membrane protein
MTLAEAAHAYSFIGGGLLVVLVLIGGAVVQHRLRPAATDSLEDSDRKTRLRRWIARCSGCLFVLVGGALAVVGVRLLLDPSATLVCNRVVTTSVACKTQFTAGGLLLLVVGLFVLLAGAQTLDRTLAWLQSLRPNS